MVIRTLFMLFLVVLIAINLIGFCGLVLAWHRPVMSEQRHAIWMDTCMGYGLDVMDCEFLLDDARR